MTAVLAIEDLRIFSFECVYARTIAEAERLLFSQPWDQVWLDWDMGGVWGSNGINSGGIVKELEDRAVRGKRHPIGRIMVHTSNTVGRARAMAALSPFYDVMVVDPWPLMTGALSY